LEEGDVDQDEDVNILLGSFMLFLVKAYKSIIDEWVAREEDLFFLRMRGAVHIPRSVFYF
jgi:chromosome condensin MukBEF MukE localization factor